MADGKIVIEIDMDTSGFEKNMKDLETTADNTSNNIWKTLWGKLENNLLQDAFSGLIDIGSAAIESASNLEKVQNALDVTFGDDAGRVEAWAASAREQFGLTELQAKQYTSTLGAMLKGMDMSGPQMLEMSTGLAGLAADIASFYNMDSETAFNEISKGLTGQSDKLRQLGVDLSDANMEAYALSEGMGKAFQQMSSGEQAVLRYQYLMKETAAVQGNFAKTSESLAGNMQMLETNWNTFLGNLGEALAPLANGVVAFLNDALEAFTPPETAEQALEKIDKAYADTTESLTANEQHAAALINSLAELESKASLDDNDLVRYRGAMEALVDIYPELAQHVDQTSGLFTVSMETIREETEALAQNVLEKERAAYATEKLQTAARDLAQKEDAYAQASAKATQAIDDHETAYDAFYQQQQNLIDLLDTNLEGTLADAGISATREQLEAFKQYVANEGRTFRNAYDLVFGADLWRGENEGLLSLEAEIDAKRQSMEELSAETLRLGDEREAATDEEVRARDAMEASRATYDGLKKRLEGVGDAATQTGDALGGSGGMAENVEDTAAAVEDLLAAGENMEDLFHQLEQYRLDNLEEVRGQLGDTFGLFDKPERVKKGDIKGDTKNLEEQAEYWKRYNAAVEVLQKKDGGDEWVAELADGSEESLSKLEMLAGASDEAYDKVNTAKTAADEAMDAAAESIAESRLQVDEAWEGITQATFDAVSELDMQVQAYESAQATGQGISNGLAAALPGIRTSINLILAQLARLGFKPNADPVPEEPNLLDRFKKGPILPRFPLGTGLATGLTYVPYNDFPAILHEGEAVLTKAQATLWRAGWTGAQAGAGSAAAAGVAAGGGSFQQVNNFNVPVQTPDEFAKTMRLYATYGLEGVI